MIDKENAAVIRIIGRRLRKARAICNFTQRHAASLIGIEARELGQIEGHVDIETIPLKIIYRASIVYDISTDFLFGVSSDWEIDSDAYLERQLGKWVHEEHCKQYAKMAVARRQYKKDIELMDELSNKLLRCCSAVSQAMGRFTEVNPDFDRMKAGSCLIYRVGLIKQFADEFKENLSKYKKLQIKEE